MSYREMYNKWINSPYVDPDTHAELKALTDEKEIEDRFYRNLEFGTAGMRGTLGAGDNRMNIYTVRRASEGLAQYIESQNGYDHGIVIAYDTRNMSPEFALETARVMSAHKIKTYLFNGVRPVPMLSYAVRQLKCMAGVVITASHNPPEYNGYKVYGPDGGQMEGSDAAQVTRMIDSITDFDQVMTISEEEARNQRYLFTVPVEIDRTYYDQVLSLVSRPALFQQMQGQFSLVYTPLHGSGRVPVLTVFEKANVPGVATIVEQMVDDGNFPTVSAPNPEESKALSLAIAKAKEIGADICLGTDPDCDRMGVAVRMDDGSFKTLTGNQIGCLMLHYLLTARQEHGTLPANGAMVKTIVTTELAAAIAQHYGVETFNVLTGFKYIAGQIAEFEQTGKYQYLFGFEESFGYMAKPFVRDKDAVQACLIMAEMAVWYKSQGMTPYQGLLKLYEQFGYYIEETVSYKFPGIEGADKIQAMMNNLRTNIPSQLASQQVVEFRDYDKQTGLSMKSGQTTPLDLPKSNVLYYQLEGDGKFVVRPSGTEPKIKFYYGIKGKTLEDSQALLEKLKDFVEKQYV